MRNNRKGGFASVSGPAAGDSLALKVPMNGRLGPTGPHPPRLPLPVKGYFESAPGRRSAEVRVWFIDAAAQEAGHEPSSSGLGRGWNAETKPLRAKLAARAFLPHDSEVAENMNFEKWLVRLVPHKLVTSS